MAILSLSLLGPFELTVNDRPVTSLASNKVRALLAYLAVESARPQRREMLAELLWPDRPGQVALGNLRYALSNLRQVIGDRQVQPPFLRITRSDIQFDTSSSVWLDVAAFQRELSTVTDHPADAGQSTFTIKRLEAAVDLHRGNFLEGLSAVSAPFEEWLVICREQYSRRMLGALQQLAGLYEARGEWARALASVRRQLDLAPWLEEAHQQTMRLLALDGQRSAALAQYATCRRVLAAELGVEPTAETTALYDSIRSREWPGRDRAPVSAPWPGAATYPPIPAVAVSGSLRTPSLSFAGRARELDRLDGFLASALDGRGQVVFITGRAGSGKTALAAAFGRRAMAAHSDLLVIWGRCSAHAGSGDPYLPFVETLRVLVGHVDTQWVSASLGPEHRPRTAAALPDAVQALLDLGPDLIGSFLSGEALATHIRSVAPEATAWAARIHDLARRREVWASGGLSPAELLAEYASVLRALARHRPLIVVLDDLQWASEGSIALLFHLARHLVGSPVLLVCAYRPAELSSNRSGHRHPLAQVVNELERELGDIRLDLEQTDGRQFVADVLDADPNRLGEAFRDMLYRRTGGHALFTVELLHAMQERGDLQRGPDGRWIDGPALDWDSLPARVGAVIAESIAQLPERWQALLAAASVEGEEFSAEVLARVLHADLSRLIRILSGSLNREHRLVEAVGVMRVEPGGRELARYRFRHYLYRSYLYQRLDSVERARLHESTGQALAALYSDRVEEIAASLAWHFEQAGNADRAADYYLQAGTRAVRLGAYADALSHLSRGLALVVTLPDSPERARREIRLQLALEIPLHVEGWRVPGREAAVARAYELSLQVGDEQHVPPGLPAMAAYSILEADYAQGLRLGEQLLGLAQRAQDPLPEAVAHQRLGAARFGLGELQAGREHLERAIALYRTHREGPEACLEYGAEDNEATCQAYLATSLDALGYFDQAREHFRQAVAAGEALAQPIALPIALTLVIGPLLLACPDDPVAWHYIELLAGLPAASRLAMFRDWTRLYRGYGLVVRGQAEAGLAMIHEGLAGLQDTGTGLGRPVQLVFLARAYGLAGQPERGLAVLDRAMAMMDRMGAHYAESEAHRLRADLLVAAGPWPLPAVEAEASLHRALEAARGYEARGWELRAALSLARLWQRQGRDEDARQLVADIYGWFTEGWDRPELQQARAIMGLS